MADEITPAGAPTGGEPGQPNADAPNGGAGTPPQPKGDQPAEKMFSQAELDRMVTDRLAEDRKRREKADTEAKLKEDGKYQELLKAKEDEAEELRRELAKRDREALIAKVAKKHSLPDELAARLQGEDEKALEEDAKSLAKFVPSEPPPPKPPANPANPAAARGGALGQSGTFQLPSWDQVYKS